MLILNQFSEMQSVRLLMIVSMLLFFHIIRE